jgi:trimeric autotransporter adhesin
MVPLRCTLGRGVTGIAENRRRGSAIPCPRPSRPATDCITPAMALAPPDRTSSRSAETTSRRRARRSPWPLVAALAAAQFVAVAPGVRAQCNPLWQPGEPIPSPRGNVHASVLWDPDGAGPLPLLLVVGGNFAVGSSNSGSVAAWNGSSWQSLGSFNGSVTALAVHNGALIATASSIVHRYDGTSWQTIGTLGVSSNQASAAAMTVFQGQLYLAGRFDTVNGTPAANIARFDGTSWAALAGGLNSSATSMALFPYANQTALYVGGSFTTANGATANRLAVWNGSSWQPTSGADNTVFTLAVRTGTSAATTYLFAGGSFGSIGGVSAHQVARLQASTGTWAALPGLPQNEACRIVYARSTGPSSWELLAAQESQVWRWNGSVWNQLGPSLETTVLQQGLGSVATLRVATFGFHGGRYVVGVADGYTSGGVFGFDGAAWRSLDGEGIDGRVLVVANDADGIIVGGGFRTISGVTVNGIARRDASGWHTFGNGVTAGVGWVRAVARLANGDLIAGGLFRVQDGAPANAIARWNGSSWSQIGNGLSGIVNAMVVMPNGDLVVAGSLAPVGAASLRHIVRWNGSAWDYVGGGVSHMVEALAVTDAGHLVAGGLFRAVGPTNQGMARIARFDGSTWQPFGIGINGSVRALAVQPGGVVIAGGAFDDAGGVPVAGLARWNGSAWQAMPQGLVALEDVRALATLPNGDILVGGSSLQVPLPGGGVSIDHAARLRASSCSPLGVGTSSLNPSIDVVDTFAVTPSGAVIAGGWFHRVGNVAAGNLARLEPTCPAAATPYGTGCTASGGAQHLEATALPWIGSTFRARASGLPTACVAFSVFGFTPVSLPLASVLPQGLPGCTLLASPDALELAVPSGGVLSTQLPIPANLALAGLSLRHQVVALEINAALNITALSAGNGLALTVGAL